MRNVALMMSASVDGYVVSPHGHAGACPEPAELKQWKLDRIRKAGTRIMGRVTYEQMASAWPTSMDDYAAPMNEIPKVVFSTTLSEVQGSARLATGTVAEEIERLRTEPGEGNIAIGGAGLAATIAEADLIDEYRAKVYPVLVGGGVPFFPQAERRVDLELLETRSFDSGVVYLRHRVRR